MKTTEIIYKQVGETPLEALERYRQAQVAAGHVEFTDVPMTYAGRLDPMAEGELLILIGDECKNKDRWLGLDKEYEVEIVFGLRTDTHDALGMSEIFDQTAGLSSVPSMLRQHVGRFTQEYPAYSSKMFGWKGDEPPTKDVEIHSIDLLGQGNITGSDLKARMFHMIDKISGEFRQSEIRQRWNAVLSAAGQSFPIIQIHVRCSSGTYMRSLAHRMGGFALAIKRTKIML
jgi:tRNA pseudouridine55 synthase